MVSKGSDATISQYHLTASVVTSLGNDHDRRNQPAIGTVIFNGTSSLSGIGITHTQEPVIESISCGIEMLTKGAEAHKKRRKANAKAKGKAKEKGMGINCHPLSQLGPSSVDHILLDMDMQSTPTYSQSYATSLSPTLPCVRESILPLPGQLSYTEAEMSTTECNMSPTKLTDIEPTYPQLSPTSSNREGEDDYSAVPVAVAVSFADMFESLLSEKRKLIQ